MTMPGVHCIAHGVPGVPISRSRCRRDSGQLPGVPYIIIHRPADTSPRYRWPSTCVRMIFQRLRGGERVVERPEVKSARVDRRCA